MFLISQHDYRTIFFILLICSLFTCTSKTPKNSACTPDFKSSDYISDSLYIDPSTIAESLLASPTIAAERIAIRQEFEKKLLLERITSANFHSFTPVLFSYRDSKTMPLFKKIVADTTVHLYFRMLSVYCIGDYGSAAQFDFLSRYFTASNPLLREYIASALHKLASTPQHFRQLERFAQTETNPYVYKTLCAKKIDEDTSLSGQIPLFEKDSIKKELFYPNESFIDFGAIGYQKVAPPSQSLPVARSCIYPHQQYKVNRALYELIDYPVVSFAFENDIWGIHVGEDSGWLFPGMPVHTIMDGVVVRMQHESTWGCLTVIESKLTDNKRITVFYGHLSHTNNVAVGDTVSMGDKIGEIGSSFTLTNGGYLAHLHLGIEKTPFTDALIKGWYHSSDRWYSPISFIANYSSGKTKKNPSEWILFKSRRQ